MNGSRGRIPNWAINEVANDVNKYGFHAAFHYFAYNNIVENMDKESTQLWRAFDKYAREHNIG